MITKYLDCYLALMLYWKKVDLDLENGFGRSPFFSIWILGRQMLYRMIDRYEH